MQLTKKFLPAMIERRSGRLLFTSSIASITATPMAAVYGATKAFVYTFAEGLRDELKSTGLTVTVLMPAPPTPTGFIAPVLALRKPRKVHWPIRARLPKQGLKR